MPVVNTGEILVKALEAQGVRKVFSIPGGQLMGVYESIRTNPNMDLIVPRQEGANALMACGYYLATGEPGVAMSTVGAGVIYELAGIHYAWLERIPVISIAPQVQSFRIKPVQESLQAMDQDDLYAPLTKFHAIIYHLDRVPQLIQRAYRIATAPEPGPVHLDLPMDIAFEKKKISQQKLERMIGKPGEYSFTGSVNADRTELERAASLIKGSKSPLALLGRLVSRRDSVKQVEGFLEKAKIPAICSNSAFAAIPKKSGLHLGTLDFYEDDKSRELLRKADLALYLEPDADTVTFAVNLFGASGPPPGIQLSSDPSHIHSFAPVSAALAGSPGLILDELSGRLVESDRKEWLDEVHAERARSVESLKNQVQQHRLRAYTQTFEAVNKSIKSEDFVICEGKDVICAAKLFLENHSPGRAILLPDSAPAGCGFPMAMGIKAAKDDARVFLLSDRKNFKYHCREFQTASRYRLGTCSIVFPDTEPLDEYEPEFSGLAESLGVKGVSIREPVEEITEEIIGEALELEAGACLEVRSF